MNIAERRQISCTALSSGEKLPISVSEIRQNAYIDEEKTQRKSELSVFQECSDSKYFKKNLFRLQNRLHFHKVAYTLNAFGRMKLTFEYRF